MVDKDVMKCTYDSRHGIGRKISIDDDGSLTPDFREQAISCIDRVGSLDRIVPFAPNIVMHVQLCIFHVLVLFIVNDYRCL